MSITKEDRKKAFRRESLRQLKKVAKQNSYKKDKVVSDMIYRYIVKNSSKNIMLYLPLAMEVNIYNLINHLRKEKRNLFVPFMEGSSFRLVKYRLPLRKRKFGIKEPNNSNQYRTKKLDLAIVPIVGIDVTKRRIGFGKGMYDRFFEKENKNIKKTIFVSRKLCYTKDVLTDHYDIKSDIIITPTSISKG